MSTRSGTRGAADSSASENSIDASAQRGAGSSGQPIAIDYRRAVPAWVREVIDTHLAIEAEDVRRSGNVGFMARALVNATLPYKDPKTDAFTRVNGDFRLRIVAGYEGGLPYGIYPRLLLSWISTEAVRRQSPEIELGESLNAFLRDVLNVQRGGGARGTSTRVSEQMKRTFGSLITAQYSGSQEHKGFLLKNVLIADEVQIDEAEQSGLWTPQQPDVAGTWQSKVRLTRGFYTECVESPVPVDLRAYKALRGSPMAMDIYTWLTYRAATGAGRAPIRWEALQNQFGTTYAFDDQGRRDFKKAFLKNLKVVNVVYPQAKTQILENGLKLLPSKPHVSLATDQKKLF